MWEDGQIIKATIILYQTENSLATMDRTTYSRGTTNNISGTLSPGGAGRVDKMIEIYRYDQFFTASYDEQQQIGIENSQG